MSIKAPDFDQVYRSVTSITRCTYKIDGDDGGQDGAAKTKGPDHVQKIPAMYHKIAKAARFIQNSYNQKNHWSARSAGITPCHAKKIRN